jgi:uncharacterized protein YbjT (DUF2867 family)
MAIPCGGRGEEKQMKIALFGASGTIGQRIVQEALARGHQVTAIARNTDANALKDPRLTVRPPTRLILPALPRRSRAAMLW